MPTEQELTLIAKAKDFDKAAGEIKKVTEADRQLAEQILKSSEASKEGTKAARQTIEAYAAQQEAARKAVPATEALTAAQERLDAAQRNLGIALKTGTVGEVERYTQEVTNAGAEVDRLSTGQERLVAAEGDFISLLQQVNPQLGLFADVGLKVVKVLDQVGSGQISVTDAVSAASKAFKDNLGLLKTFAAGGAVVAGIAAIASAFRQVKAEADAATKAINENAEAATKAAREARARETEIGRISAQGREGPLTPEEVRTLGGRVATARERFPGLEEGALNEAAARLGTQASVDDLIDAALLGRQGRIQFPAEESRERAFERFGRVRGRFGEFLEGERQIGSTEGLRSRQASEARRQINVQGGNREALTALLEQLPGTLLEGQDIDVIAQIVQALGGISEGDKTKQQFRGFGRPFTGAPLDTNAAFRDVQITRELVDREGIDLSGSGSPEETVRVAEIAARLIRRQLEREAESGSPANVTVNVNNQNSRNVVPGRRSEDAVRNGESRIRDVQRTLSPNLTGRFGV